MQVLILAAGYATRLYPLTQNTPKPLLPIKGKPLIDYLLDKVEPIKELSSVVVVTNDKFYSHFEKWAGGYRNFKAKIRIVNDQTQSNEDRLGSIGDVDFVLRKGLITDDLLVLGGDNLFEEKLDGFGQWARQRSPAAVVGVFDIKDKKEAAKFGVVSVDPRGKIISFEEKPQNPQSTLIGMCLYFFPKPTLPRVSQYLQESRTSDTTGDYIQWLSQTEDVYGFTFHGKWYDIGSLEAYREAEEKFLR